MKRSVVVLIGILSLVVVVLVAALAFLLGRGSTSSPNQTPAAATPPPSASPTPSVAPTRLADGTPTGDLLVDQATIQCAEITAPMSCERGFVTGASLQMSSYATKGHAIALSALKATIQTGFDLQSRTQPGINPAIYSTGFLEGTGYVNLLWFDQHW